MTHSAEHLTRTREAARGVVVTTVTPFDPDTLALDEAGARANLEVLAASKIAAVIPAGNTGEFHSLTRDEIVRMTRITVAGVASHQVVMVGTGGELGSAIELARMAEAEAGTRAVAHLRFSGGP
jgi:4-hydroxy-tetrahydrodipicolinate synthase